jgi:hypothetical protein
MTTPAVQVPPPGDLLCLLTLGRSGSTLLQRLLNTHEQIVMFGEHNTLVGGLRGLWQQTFAEWSRAARERAAPYVEDLLEARPVLAPDGFSIEWTNAYTEATALPVFRRFLEDLLYPPHLRRPGIRHWGFKEIRYGPPAAVFLARLFPEARFLVLVRDPLAVQRSRLATSFWYPGRDAAQAAAILREEVKTLAALWETLAALPGDRARLVTYEALVADHGAVLEGVAGWAGLPPFDPGRTAAVMASPARPAEGRRAEPPRVAAFLPTYAEGGAAEDAATLRAVVAAAGAAGRLLPGTVVGREVVPADRAAG